MFLNIKTSLPALLTKAQCQHDILFGCWLEIDKKMQSKTLLYYIRTLFYVVAGTCFNSLNRFVLSDVILVLCLDLMGDSGEEEATGKGGSIRKQGEQGEPGEERREGGEQRPRGC